MSAPMPGALAAPTIVEAFRRTLAAHADELAMRSTAHDRTLTWRELDGEARRVGAGLRASGVGVGDTVGLLLTNRMEAGITDLATLLIGAVPVSFYNTAPVDQLHYLVGDSSIRVLVTETALAEKARQAITGILPEVTVVVVDGEPAQGTTTFDQLASGQPALPSDEWPDLVAEDVVSVIYTSGTTGEPKGVELAHDGMLSQMRDLHQIGRMPMGGAVLSYLPFAHLGDRLCSWYMPIVMGATIVYHPDPRTAIAALPAVNSKLFMTVPRIWQKIQVAIERSIDGLDPAEAEAIRAGQAVGRRVHAERVALRKPSAELLEEWSHYDRPLTDLRRRWGFAEAELLYNGAAPLPPETLEFFHSCGIDVVESAGLTETSGIILCNRVNRARPNTVGEPLPSVELRRAEDGELLVRGAQVMKAYRNKPAQTAEAIDAEGWLHTGDVVEVDEDGYWRIIDRKKDLIISSAGKNMAPAMIENTILTSTSLLASAICVGDARAYNTALVTLDGEAARLLTGSSDATVNADDERVQARVRQAMVEANTKLNGDEQIKRFTILPTSWLPGSEEMSPTSKLRRRTVISKYSDAIEALYGPPSPAVLDVVAHTPRS